MRKWLLLTLTVGGCSAPTDQEMWSRPWTQPTVEVARTLAAQGVKGCGEYYQKENTTSIGDYAVACTRMPDGRLNWVGYEVFPATGKVMGPDETAIYMQFGGSPRTLTKKDL
jgi:hypothetical protein